MERMKSSRVHLLCAPVKYIVVSLFILETIFSLGVGRRSSEDGGRSLLPWSSPSYAELDFCVCFGIALPAIIFSNGAKNRILIISNFSRYTESILFYLRVSVFSFGFFHTILLLTYLLAGKKKKVKKVQRHKWRNLFFPESTWLNANGY